MATKPETIDDYLSEVSDQQRSALEKLRRTIRAAAPRAEECISYGIPGFRLNGYLVGFAAWKQHCAFYPGGILKEYASELENYPTSKGTIQFQPDSPLPATLVRKIVKARVAQNAARKAKSRSAGAKS
jgi:uncharacterized protein YdhG (YjbR/CyaY superfamily)